MKFKFVVEIDLEVEETNIKYDIVQKHLQGDIEEALRYYNFNVLDTEDIKKIEPTWYVLYDGESVDGRGNPKFVKRTIDKQEAIQHLEYCKRNPYSSGKVVAFTDTKETSIYFNTDLI